MKKLSDNRLLNSPNLENQKTDSLYLKKNDAGFLPNPMINKDIFSKKSIHEVHNGDSSWAFAIRMFAGIILHAKNQVEAFWSNYLKPYAGTTSLSTPAHAENQLELHQSVDLRSEPDSATKLNKNGVVNKKYTRVSFLDDDILPLKGASVVFPDSLAQQKSAIQSVNMVEQQAIVGQPSLCGMSQSYS